MGKKRSLGKGLSAILGEVEEAYAKEVPQDEIVEIDVEAIRFNPFQPRKKINEQTLQELAQSIQRHGLLQPIIVMEDVDGYILIAGERRLRASKLAGLTKIKAILAKIDKSKFRELALIENIQREDLHPLELAYSYKELIDEYGITHEELSNIVKKSRTHITNTLRLLQLSEYAKQALEEEKITAGHAKVLVGLDEEEQKLLIDSIVGQKLSVREAEKLVSQQKKSVTKSDKTQRNPLDMKVLKERLARHKIPHKLSNNKLVIELDSQELVNKLVEIFS